MSKEISVAPSARRLTTSLRDIGYSFESAVADIVDNSIAANATRVDISIVFEGRNSSILIADNGDGMTPQALDEAMRFGSRRQYSKGELGRYGLGLKTASLSQCRRLEVFTKYSTDQTTVSRVLDLDFIQAMDDWIILDTTDDEVPQAATLFATNGSGTLIIWKKLDRILSMKDPEGGWARRRIESLIPKVSKYLSMVFHRFLGGETKQSLSITVNGMKLDPWDPFARDEPRTQLLPKDEFELEHESVVGTVSLTRFLLPSQSEFSSREAFVEASGMEKWNKQQGLYIYRADRLVQWGGWAGIRTLDEHTKSARAALDFDTDLDEAFNINVAKMRVSVPAALKKVLEQPINELCIQADAAYRRSSDRPSSPRGKDALRSEFSSDGSGEQIGLALRAAAFRTGHRDAFAQISQVIKEEMPELALHLGIE